MLKKINYQFLISYLGLVPYIYIIIDKYFFSKITEDIIYNFIIYYSIIILTFIGSINWNLNTKIKNSITIYGFLPSLFAVLIIVLNLYEFNKILLINALAVFFLLQLVFDYFIIHSPYKSIHIYYLLRLPLTLGIILMLILTII